MKMKHITTVPWYRYHLQIFNPKILPKKYKQITCFLPSSHPLTVNCFPSQISLWEKLLMMPSLSINEFFVVSIFTSVFFSSASPPSRLHQSGTLRKVSHVDPKNQQVEIPEATSNLSNILKSNWSETVGWTQQDTKKKDKKNTKEKRVLLFSVKHNWQC